MCCKTAKHKVLYNVVQYQGFVLAGLGFDPALYALRAAFSGC